MYFDNFYEDSQNFNYRQAEATRHTNAVLPGQVQIRIDFSHPDAITGIKRASVVESPHQTVKDVLVLKNEHLKLQVIKDSVEGGRYTRCLHEYRKLQPTHDTDGTLRFDGGYVSTTLTRRQLPSFRYAGKITELGEGEEIPFNTATAEYLVVRRNVDSVTVLVMYPGDRVAQPLVEVSAKHADNLYYAVDQLGCVPDGEKLFIEPTRMLMTVASMPAVVPVRKQDGSFLGKVGNVRDLTKSFKLSERFFDYAEVAGQPELWFGIVDGKKFVENSKPYQIAEYTCITRRPAYLTEKQYVSPLFDGSWNALNYHHEAIA